MTSFNPERQSAYRIRQAQLQAMYARGKHQRSRTQIAADIDRARAKATFPKKEIRNQN